MSKRLQILLTPQELSQIKNISSFEKKTVSHWVRELIKKAIAQQPATPSKELMEGFRNLKLPSPPIDQMLKEIEKGRE